MRRRPQEDDQEQDERLEPDVSGRRRPADDRRQRAGGAADDDILWRAAASATPYTRRHRRRSRRRAALLPSTLSARPRTATAPPARTSPNTSASVRETLPRGIGRIGGARHHGIDVGVVPHVEHAGGTSAHGDGENCDQPENGSRWPGAIINPTSAVNTASTITRGFISAKKSDRRVVNRDDEGNCSCWTGIAVVFMINHSRCRRYTREIRTRVDVVQSRALGDPPNGGARRASKGDITAANRQAARDYDRV